MKPFDDAGHEVDAIFSVLPIKNGVQLILESRGGGESGPRPPRNAGYGRGFELLVRRLGEHDAVLVDLEVFSGRTKDWPIDQRRIRADGFPLPLSLSELSDIEGFRLQVGRASAALGRPKGDTVGGNGTKRLRFTVRWPSAAGLSGDQLENLLAKAARSPTRAGA